MKSRSKLLQSISGLFIIWTFNLQTLYLFFLVALVASFSLPLIIKLTDHPFHGQKPWTRLKIMTRSLFKVSSLNQRTLWTENLHLSALPKRWTCAEMQIPCVTGALTRLSLCLGLSICILFKLIFYANSWFSISFSCFFPPPECPP